MEFANPPVVELVLGVQFAPLGKFTGAHFGRFWNELREHWSDPGEYSPLRDHFEQFGPSGVAETTPIIFSVPPERSASRFVLRHVNQDRLIQVQATRFHLNWRKRDGVYPSYNRIVEEFESLFRQFTEFCAEMGLGTPILNQWEVTYVDAFPKGEYWETPKDWTTILPGLFGDLFPSEGLDIALEHRAAQLCYEIKPQQGRLYIAAGLGRIVGHGTDTLLLHTTARGPLEDSGSSSLRKGLDLGHQVAVNVFLRITSDTVKQKWKPLR